MIAAPGFRLTRAAVFAVACVGVSGGAHALAGHAAPAAPALAAGGALALAFGYLLAGRERSLPVILAAMFAGEAGLHLVFGALGPSAAPAAPMPAHLMATHLMTGHPMAGGHAVAMVLAHAWAGLLASWWLHRGEHAVWALLRRLGARLLGRLRPAPFAYALPPARTAATRVVPPRTRLIRYCRVQRGPPVTGA